MCSYWRSRLTLHLFRGMASAGELGGQDLRHRPLSPDRLPVRPAGKRSPRTDTPQALVGLVVVAVGRVRRPYLLSPATRLIVMAMMTVPNRKDTRACRRTVLRICMSTMSVSETWKVIPTVNAT